MIFGLDYIQIALIVGIGILILMTLKGKKEPTEVLPQVIVPSSPTVLPQATQALTDALALAQEIEILKAKAKRVDIDKAIAQLATNITVLQSLKGEAVESNPLPVTLHARTYAE